LQCSIRGSIYGEARLGNYVQPVLKETTTMLRKILGWSGRPLIPGNENSREANAELPQQRNVRAFATGAALAASIDVSPAVLVSIYDYAHRYRDRPRRTA
jgi:hypothetical protein